MKKVNMKERYIGTLLGCGIGDTLGMPVEAWNKSQIKNHVPGGYVKRPMDPIILYDKNGELITEDEFGKYRYYTKNIKKWEITDDTLLTLAIAESLAEKGDYDIFDATEGQVDIYNEYKDTRFGPRTSTSNAFERINEGESPLESGMSPGTGNGISMKISPVGMFMHATGKHLQGLNFTRLIGKSTHLDERAIAAGVVQAHAIYELLDDPTESEFLDSLVQISQLSERSQEYVRLKERGNLTEKLSWIKENYSASPEEALDYLGNSGLAFESFPFSIFMFQKYWDSPMKGLLETINFGGDCDTTGAMYGALAGAKNGIFFPKKWIPKLEYNKELKSAAEAIYILGEDD